MVGSLRALELQSQRASELQSLSENRAFLKEHDLPTTIPGLESQPALEPIAGRTATVAAIPQSRGLRCRQRHLQSGCLGRSARRVRGACLNDVRSFEAGAPLVSDANQRRPSPCFSRRSSTPRERKLAASRRAGRARRRAAPVPRSSPVAAQQTSQRAERPRRESTSKHH
jgi:hypothetical protein